MGLEGVVLSTLYQDISFRLYNGIINLHACLHSWFRHQGSVLSDDPLRRYPPRFCPLRGCGVYCWTSLSLLYSTQRETL